MGHLGLRALGTPGGADDTDMGIALSLTNVMRTSDLSDYTGELGVDLSLRLTDRAPPASQTSMDFGLSVVAPCTATTSTIDRSHVCARHNRRGFDPRDQRGRAFHLRPRARSGPRQQVPDEDADTPADEGVLATQGLFVP